MKTYVHTKMCTWMLLATAPKLERTQMPIIWKMDKQNGLCVKQCCLAFKRKEKLIHAATWMNLETTMKAKKDGHKDHTWDSIRATSVKSPQNPHVDSRSLQDGVRSGRHRLARAKTVHLSKGKTQRWTCTRPWVWKKKHLLYKHHTLRK
jgi:hypothetical protein